MDGTPVQCRAPWARTFTTRCNVVSLIRLLSCFWDVGGNLRTWMKLGAVESMHRNSTHINLSAGDCKESYDNVNMVLE